MHERKWKKHRRSKYRFPTRVVKTGVKGTLVVGSGPAYNSVVADLGRRLVGNVTRHTWSQWVFCEPLNGA